MLDASANLPKLDLRRHRLVTAFRIILRHGLMFADASFLIETKQRPDAFRNRACCFGHWVGFSTCSTMFPLCPRSLSVACLRRLHSIASLKDCLYGRPLGQAVERGLSATCAGRRNSDRSRGIWKVRCRSSRWTHNTRPRLGGVRTQNTTPLLGIHAPVAVGADRMSHAASLDDTHRR
jgi:hypothetical protein